MTLATERFRSPQRFFATHDAGQGALPQAKREANSATLRPIFDARLYVPVEQMVPLTEELLAKIDWEHPQVEQNFADVMLGSKDTPGLRHVVITALDHGGEASSQVFDTLSSYLGAQTKDLPPKPTQIKATVLAGVSVVGRELSSFIHLRRTIDKGKITNNGAERFLLADKKLFDAHVKVTSNLPPEESLPFALFLHDATATMTNEFDRRNITEPFMREEADEYEAGRIDGLVNFEVLDLQNRRVRYTESVAIEVGNQLTQPWTLETLYKVLSVSERVKYYTTHTSIAIGIIGRIDSLQGIDTSLVPPKGVANLLGINLALVHDLMFYGIEKITNPYSSFGVVTLLEKIGKEANSDVFEATIDAIDTQVIGDPQKESQWKIVLGQLKTALPKQREAIDSVIEELEDDEVKDVLADRKPGAFWVSRTGKFAVQSVGQSHNGYLVYTSTRQANKETVQHTKNEEPTTPTIAIDGLGEVTIMRNSQETRSVLAYMYGKPRKLPGISSLERQWEQLAEKATITNVTSGSLLLEPINSGPQVTQAKEFGVVSVHVERFAQDLTICMFVIKDTTGRQRLVAISGILDDVGVLSIPGSEELDATARDITQFTLNNLALYSINIQPDPTSS